MINEPPCNSVYAAKRLNKRSLLLLLLLLLDPICCDFCKGLSMFLRMVSANPTFSLRDINLTPGPGSWKDG